ncbi:MAG: hypothetical protein EHM47_00910 [Ignavibacteriales bacterium]|nr:MAG: hypothetical protein EHM47_00910 [Ignavibacteriales bacterium]
MKKIWYGTGKHSYTKTRAERRLKGAREMYGKKFVFKTKKMKVKGRKNLFGHTYAYPILFQKR